MKSEKDKLSKIEVVGRLLTKEIDGQNMVNLSEEVAACVLNLSSNSTYVYSLYLTNKDQNDNSNWEHLSFDLKPSMQLAYFSNNEVDCIQWFTKKNLYFLEILIDEYNERNKNNFWKILEQCLCSIANNIPIERAALKTKKTSTKYLVNYGIINDLGAHINNMMDKLQDKSHQEMLEEKITKELSNLQITPPKIDSILNLSVAKKIFSVQGEMYNYDTNKDELVNLNNNKKVLLSVYRIDSQRFDYALCTETLNELLISIDKISEKINGQIINNENSKFFCWITSKCYTNIIGDCLGFLFDNNDDSEKLRSLLEKCNYESKYNEPYENIEENNRKMLEKATDYSNINCFSSDEEEDKKEEEAEEEKKVEKKEKKTKKSRKKTKKNREEIMDIDEKYKEVESSKEKINKFCIDSLSNDRTFCVTDDNQIVVYKASPDDDDTLEKLTSMPVVQEYKGKNVCFSQGMLYKSENNMLLLDENNPYALYQYDLPKEKIVNEWKTDKVTISDICSLKKNGQMTDEPLIYGVNPKSVFTLDERVSNKNNIVDIKTYSHKNNANKIMSNNNGQFVTGSTKGDLRLYDKMGIKAKNLFSFYGDPIRFIDISSDDQYILLTCDKYLLLLNAGNEDKSAFLKTIKTDERKTPLRLQIKTTDVAKYGLVDANYTAAKFNVNKNGENNIITSLGEYIIIWNYNDIRKGKITNYKIKKVNDIVIDNYFKVGRGNKIIIAMPTKVRIQNQKKIFG